MTSLTVCIGPLLLGIGIYINRFLLEMVCGIWFVNVQMLYRYRYKSNEASSRDVPLLLSPAYSLLLPLLPFAC